jgi:hypothetical protein
MKLPAILSFLGWKVEMPWPSEIRGSCKSKLDRFPSLECRERESLPLALVLLFSINTEVSVC